MKNIDLIKVNTSLGLIKNGTELGANAIYKAINKELFNCVYDVNMPTIKKDLEENNKRKNIVSINKLNCKLFQIVDKSLKSRNVPITIGGDHSLSIATCLASKSYKANIGLIWFDAHADFNTFETTITGNVHGLPFASVVGQNGNELTSFFHRKIFFA